MQSRKSRLLLNWNKAIHRLFYVETFYVENRKKSDFKGKKVADISTGWHATLKRAGIERRIRPYDLRHAFGTELIAAGVDVGTVAKLMGHSNPVMLLTHYQYVMDRQKKEAIESLPKFGHVPETCASEKGDEKHGVE
ncbi:MAG: tyrosine-type recombinase/integrase [Desulfovibrio sp.]|nr:tyrosine-type recombinase/integrase [Desulfovibrio sp.]